MRITDKLGSFLSGMSDDVRLCLDNGGNVSVRFDSRGTELLEEIQMALEKDIYVGISFTENVYVPIEKTDGLLKEFKTDGSNIIFDVSNSHISVVDYMAFYGFDDNIVSMSVSFSPYKDGSLVYVDLFDMSEGLSVKFDAFVVVSKESLGNIKDLVTNG